MVSSLVYPLKPDVSMTSVSPSQRAVDTPVQLGGKSAGHLKFGSNEIQWNHVFCSKRNAKAPLPWTIWTPCGELMLRDIPKGRQLPAMSPFFSGSYSFHCFNP